MRKNQLKSFKSVPKKITPLSKANDTTTNHELMIEEKAQIDNLEVNGVTEEGAVPVATLGSLVVEGSSLEIQTSVDGKSPTDEPANTSEQGTSVGSEAPETEEKAAETPVSVDENASQPQMSSEEKTPKDEPKDMFEEGADGGTTDSEDEPTGADSDTPLDESVKFTEAPTSVEEKTSTDLPPNTSELEFSSESPVTESESQEMEDDLEEADGSILAGFNQVSVNASTVQGGRTLNATMTVVNHKNGQRVKFRRDIMATLEFPECIDVSVNKEKGMVAVTADTKGQLLRGSDKVKNILYNKHLVEEITEAFQLDFANRSSIGVMNINYKKVNGKVYAFISK